MIKQIIKTATLFAIVALVSCKKDGSIVTATDGTMPGFSANTTSVQYTIADSSNTAITFNWTPSDFGYQSALTYDLLLSTDSTFSDKTKLTDQSFASNITSQTYTVDKFNTFVLASGGVAGEISVIYARLKCSAASTLVQSSPVITITVDAPYIASNDPTYPKIWAPGDYQGWAPGGDGCAALYSPNSDGKYQGCIMVTPTSSADLGKFKLTSEADWNHTNFGWASDPTPSAPGNLSTDGSAGNLWVASPGYWRIDADINALTWKTTLQNWGICGTVEGNNWDNTNAIPFDFDAANQVLIRTITCVAGDQFKVLVNNLWDINLGGDYDASSGNVSNFVQGGNNITIPSAGTYKVTLDMRVPNEPKINIIAQ